MLGPTLTGEKIRLEPTRDEYLEEFVRWFADMQITRYLFTRFPLSIEQEREWFSSMCKDRNSVHWTIMEGDRPIGVTGFNKINWVSRGAASGTIIGVKDAWGKGYATEAVRLRTQFAFDEMNVERIESSSMAPNVGMHKALQRSGYRKIGTASRYLFRQGQWIDAFLFECLRVDWDDAQSATTAES
jgi:RimJ/RimL family protein N-acetyltransferase